MTLFFAIILLVLGQDYLVSAPECWAKARALFYILDTSLAFAVYLSILKLGVRTFVGELTAILQGIQNKVARRDRRRRLCRRLCGSVQKTR